MASYRNFASDGLRESPWRFFWTQNGHRDIGLFIMHCYVFIRETLAYVHRRDCVLCSEERLCPVFRGEIVSCVQRRDCDLC